MGVFDVRNDGMVLMLPVDVVIVRRVTNGGRNEDVLPARRRRMKDDMATVAMVPVPLLLIVYY